MKAIGPPRVGIRAVREAYGLSVRELIERIAEHGVDVKPATIRNVETGRFRPGRPLLVAWAKALQLSPLDVVLPAQGNAAEDESAPAAA